VAGAAAAMKEATLEAAAPEDPKDALSKKVSTWRRGGGGG